MVQICCPVCGGILAAGAHSWQCGAGHSFDVARQGYVNLLTVGRKHSRQPGDSPHPAGGPARIPRRRILRAAGGRRVLYGCGGGAADHPGRRLRRGLLSHPPGCSAAGGRALGRGHCQGCRAPGGGPGTAPPTGSRRQRPICPFADGAFDCVISMFALTAAEEFRRVLRPGGLFLQVTAGPEHLLALRRLIYPEIREHGAGRPETLEGFRLERTETVEFPIALSGNRQVQDLLAMTPHFMRISKEGADRVRTAEGLTDRVQAVLPACSGLFEEKEKPYA